jgi:hypothetical protein
MAIVPIKLSGYEQQLIRLLAKHQDDENDEYRVDLLVKDEVNGNETLRTIDRFRRYGLVEWKTNVTIRILPSLLEAADMLDNPPPADYWKNIVTWFRSRWWSVALLALAVGLPLLVQWIEMLKAVLRWFGFID